MDPVTHTMVGLGLAQSGLKRRSALSTATLVIGSSLPDIDALSYLAGPTTSLLVRRGWTHGVLALAVWPFVLTGLMVLWHRWARTRPPGADPFRPGAILGLAALSVWLHPSLDYLNTYGMRWLMPLSDRWFYFDTLFLVDLVILAMLMLGSAWARRLEQRGDPGWHRPARLALAGTAVYIALMIGLNLVGRRIVLQDFARAGIEVEQLMLSPVPITPLDRVVVAEDAEGYYVGRLRWVPWSLTWARSPLPKRPTSPLSASAVRGPEPRNFLGWSRFPYFVERRGEAEDQVVIGDLRYSADPTIGWSRVIVRIPHADPP
jgi:inner membrane protein